MSASPEARLLPLGLLRGIGTGLHLCSLATRLLLWLLIAFVPRAKTRSGHCDKGRLMRPASHKNSPIVAGYFNLSVMLLLLRSDMIQQLKLQNNELNTICYQFICFSRSLSGVLQDGSAPQPGDD